MHDCLFIDDAAQFRQFCCPAGGDLIENEVCRAQDPIRQDIGLDLEEVRRALGDDIITISSSRRSPWPRW